jgi:hypothetical protein
MSWTTSGCADDGQIERTFLATVINQKCKSIPNYCRGQYKRATAYSEVVIYLFSWSETMAGGLDVRSRNAISLIFRSLWPLFTEQNRYTSPMGIHVILCTWKRTISGSVLEWALDSSQKPPWPAGDNQIFRIGCDTHSKVIHWLTLLFSLANR